MRTRPVTQLVLAAAMFVVPSIGECREGDPDATFNGNGTLTFTFDDFAANNLANAVAIQPDGKIVVAGVIQYIEPPSVKWALARLNPDGSFDDTFGTGGKVTFAPGALTHSADALALAIQADGKIVVGGWYDVHLAIARFNVDGTPDAGFGSAGVYLGDPGGGTQPYVADIALVPQASGGQLILFVGGSSTGIGGSSFLRGFIDSTGMFAHTDLLPPGPYNVNAFASMVVQGGNHVAMAGMSLSSSDPFPAKCSVRRYRLGLDGIGILRYFDDSTFDPSDFTLGASSDADCRIDSMALVPSGDLVLGGHQTQGDPSDQGAFAYGLHGADGTSTGMLYKSAFAVGFNTVKVLVQADGKILLTGSATVAEESSFVVQRHLWQADAVSTDLTYATNGAAAINFDHGGTATTSTEIGAVLDGFGRAILVGTTRDTGASTSSVAIARLQGDLIFRDGFD